MKLSYGIAILMALVVAACANNDNACYAGLTTSADVQSSDADTNSEEEVTSENSAGARIPLDVVEEEPDTTTAEDGGEAESASSDANDTSPSDNAEESEATTASNDDEAEAESESSEAEDSSPSDEEVEETSVPLNANDTSPSDNAGESEATTASNDDEAEAEAESESSEADDASPSDNLFAGNMASIAMTQQEISEQQAAANAELEKANALLSRIATNGKALVDAKAIDHQLARQAIALQQQQLEATTGNSTPNVATTTPLEPSVDTVSLDEAEAAAIRRIRMAGSTAVTLVESASNDAVESVNSARITTLAQVKKAGDEEIEKISAEREGLLGDIAALLDKRGLTEKPEAVATASKSEQSSTSDTVASTATIEPNRSVAGLSHTWSRHNADGSKGSCAPLAAGQKFAPCPHCGSTGACNGHTYGVSGAVLGATTVVSGATTVVSGATTVVSGATSVVSGAVTQPMCNRSDGGCNSRRIVGINN